MKILTNDFLPVTCGLCLFAGDIPRFGCGSVALANSRGECFFFYCALAITGRRVCQSVALW